MTKPSFEKFNYAMRPAKHAQRKMLCEAFQQLCRIAPLSSYRYVGFGSVGFHDFSLFHQRLGISDMVSIEGTKAAKERVLRNRPFSCIKMEWGWSYDVLPKLDWSSLSIVWLDYEHALNTQMLEDIALLSSVLQAGSVLLITVPVEPRDDGNGTRTRLAGFSERVGLERVPYALKGTDLSGWGTATASRNVIHNEIIKTLQDRNAALAKGERTTYRQLFNFVYADGKKMLTVGGVLGSPQNHALLRESVTTLEFIRSGQRAYHIDSPVLTAHELRLLDACLPDAPEDGYPNWIPARERNKYVKLYRHFPRFGVVEA